MTIAEMRQLLGLGDDVSDAAVAEAYAASLSGVAQEAGPLPVTLAEAKLHLRLPLDDATRDGEISGMIADAVAWVEQASGHQLFARALSQPFRAFGDLPLFWWPVATSAEPVVTFDDGDEDRAVDGVRIVHRGTNAIVTLRRGFSWPSGIGAGGVMVTVRAGYERGADVPGPLRRAVLIMIEGYDRGGEALTKFTASAQELCDRVRRYAL